MSHLSRSQGVAAFILVVGAALSAGADEGPAINPAVYKVPAGAKTVNVDCDAQQTLQAALGDKSTGDLNIVFSGTCKEYVTVQRDHVAIRGKDASATVVGAVEVESANGILLENFTCRDNAQLEFCVGALHGSSVTLHNIKVFNSLIRGVMVFNSTAIIDGLSVDKTVSTSILVRGSQVRFEGELNFSNTIEGCVVIDGVSSVFSKNGVLTARDCGAGMVVQNNSAFQAPFATFRLDANGYAGLMVLTHGAFSYGGSVSVKNNKKAGIFVDDLSSFAPFSNIETGSTVALENNGGAGVFVSGGSRVELANVTANAGSDFGVRVDDGGMLRIRAAKVSGNKQADIRLTFGARAVFGDGVVFDTLTCDGTQQLRGAKVTCAESAAKPADAKTEKK